MDTVLPLKVVVPNTYDTMKTNWVKAGDTWVDVEDVEVLGCDETPYGDSLTFDYEGKTYESLCVIGSQPG